MLKKLIDVNKSKYLKNYMKKENQLDYKSFKKYENITIYKKYQR